ncbi:DMT family transporter [Notoacmeibacter sp. MSK16QG-6]|uniref:DMT family transporter n=1 Tax=Notoacmeibacter sp. MSK16QG-6 TaxID=2957982 RepID=UPI0020A149F2|nr:DMT family transporter [Notoacmeibacter sp. MSK16QG-6]MCP1198106.1 DMT family transporter [Notoacmeibacter sp. MSK16QG-6]
MAPFSPEPQPLKGIGLKLLSVSTLFGMISCIKAAGDMPTGQLVFFRSFFAVPFVLGWLATRGHLRGAWRTGRPIGHIVRGLFGVAAMACNFYALTLLPLPDATALFYANPLFVTIISAVFLGEMVRLFRWGAVIVGLIGVVIISWPQITLTEGFGGAQGTGVMFALLGAFFAAWAMVMVRKLVNTEDSATIVLWFSMVASAAALATLPFGWRAPTMQEWILLLSSGALGGLGQILLTQSYRYASLATIAPFEYTSMLLAIVIGFAIFNEIPTIYTIAGSAVIIAAGLLIIWREHKLGLERRRAKKLSPPS